MTSRVAFGSAAALLVAWVMLAFVVAIPSGWVHLLLAVGATLIAVAIVRTQPAGPRSPNSRTAPPPRAPSPRDTPPASSANRSSGPDTPA